MKISVGIICSQLLILNCYATDVESREWSPKKWENYHTPELALGHSRGPYLLDPYTWAYTSSFAARYGMPKEWIDDSLIGVEAVTYRIEPQAAKMCGYFRDANACSQDSSCKFDFYVADSASIPWKDDRPQGFAARDPERSTRFLVKQKQEELHTYDPQISHKFNRYKALVGPPMGYSMDFDVKTNTQTAGGSLRISEFDREFLHGIDYISTTISCSFPRSPEGIPTFKFYISPKDQSIGDYTTSKIGYMLTLSRNYMDRVNKAHQRNKSQNSFMQMVKKRTGSKPKQQ